MATINTKDRIAIVVSVLWIIITLTAGLEGLVVGAIGLAIYWGYRFIKNDISFLTIQEQKPDELNTIYPEDIYQDKPTMKDVAPLYKNNDATYTTRTITSGQQEESDNSILYFIIFMIVLLGMIVIIPT